MDGVLSSRVAGRSELQGLVGPMGPALFQTRVQGFAISTMISLRLNIGGFQGGS